MTSIGDEIKEWERLLNLTSVKNVRDKINKHITDLKCMSPYTNGFNNSNNKQDKPSVIQKTISEFSWEQESSLVKIRIKFDNISSHDKSNIHLSCEEQSVSLQINEFKSAAGVNNFIFRIPKLHAKIMPDKAAFHLKTNYIVLTLQKESAGHWPNVEYKQSSLSKPKVPEDKDSDPNAMLIDLMKNLYQEGDDEMKRTIAKAWTEASEKRNVV